MSPCPSNSLVYNKTLCNCNPGYVYNVTTKNCTLFNSGIGDFVMSSGVDYSITFPATIFSFDSIKKFTQSQAVFLEATLILILTWLLFCFAARFGKLGDGRTLWFKIRWRISRLDICFATRHWLDDQQLVKKRKTELGGTLSVASCILFIGLFAALLYQIISKRSIEVHNVRASNAPDLVAFMNDMEFNITTISSMSCSNLHDLGTLVFGSPGSIDYRVTSLSAFANYSCQNTTYGPTIILKCNKCQIIADNMYVSWRFVDLPNIPATAVGFQFNLTAKNPANKKHVSFVSSSLKNGNILDGTPVTFRGPDPNILRFNLFPRIYRNLHDLRLIQPLFHNFVPGTSFHESSLLQASLENSSQGLINTTLSINFLSAYIVEIDNQNILGPVSFLADVGGLYCISIGIFYYFLVQCEYRIKKLRSEDSVLRRVRNRRKAQDRWDKYVTYTWGSSNAELEYDDTKEKLCCSGIKMETFNRNISSQRRRTVNHIDTISFNRKTNLAGDETTIQESSCCSLGDKSCSVGTASNGGGRGEAVSKSKAVGATKDERKNPVDSEANAARKKAFSFLKNNSIPRPPSIDFEANSEIELTDLQKDIQNLYDYNVMLREKLLSAQSMLDALAQKSTSPDMKSGE
ncbi:hypothetical protein RJ641_020401 [Dillenia turbinata]|uniref:Transmembrane protein n=1 Tax=Dillenia turbinata TaxID=194707 RepID=A0AAN8YU32_9MAGN